jgi:hypothetical protein
MESEGGNAGQRQQPEGRTEREPLLHEAGWHHHSPDAYQFPPRDQSGILNAAADIEAASSEGSEEGRSSISLRQQAARFYRKFRK